MSINPILVELEVAMRARREVELLSYFKGVPVLYRAQVEHVGGGVIDIHSTDIEIVCLLLEKQVILLGDALEEPAHADIISVELAAGKARLGNFQYVGTKLGNRMVVRVEPKEAVPVELESGGQKISAKLADISMDGLAVRLATPGGERPLKLHSMVQVIFGLPTAEVKLVGSVRSMRPESDNMHRLGIVFSQDAQIKDIAAYITQRRAEILSEIKITYEEMSKRA